MAKCKALTGSAVKGLSIAFVRLCFPRESESHKRKFKFVIHVLHDKRNQQLRGREVKGQGHRASYEMLCNGINAYLKFAKIPIDVFPIMMYSNLFIFYCFLLFLS